MKIENFFSIFFRETCYEQLNSFSNPNPCRVKKMINIDPFGSPAGAISSPGYKGLLAPWESCLCVVVAVEPLSYFYRVLSIFDN